MKTCSCNLILDLNVSSIPWFCSNVCRRSGYQRRRKQFSIYWTMWMELSSLKGRYKFDKRKSCLLGWWWLWQAVMLRVHFKQQLFVSSNFLLVFWEVAFSIWLKTICKPMSRLRSNNFFIGALAGWLYCLVHQALERRLFYWLLQANLTKICMWVQQFSN